ncbi:uncharacterized Fe-S center protein [Longilinea arvoryzae]|uniref:Uncharacterized Fe-S center protein n=1 Tax=Longilinea arvoryzae TaxID=360412 RepID=A0A0S7BAT0_9CHLR|nr:DUF362 domain-containing protein [Longilinea arvoryzae]GAP14799.1 uncharacterized Fe-S center protein [Longilinea arvoryzae]
MSSSVYFGSARQARLVAEETLPAKLDLIIDRLHLRERVKGETVALKIHTGNHIGYSMIHPVFLRKVVQAIREGGGKPFAVDVDWDVAGAETRGYTTEVLGCPIYPSAGLSERHFYAHEHPFKNIKTWKVAGLIEEASFLVNFAHAKGHPACSYGGAFKNLALGCMVGETRGQMHDTVHFDRYWFAERCPDSDTRKRILEACPHNGIVEDKFDPTELHLHFDECNNCGRCLQVAPEGSLKIDAVNFDAFQEAMAISTSITMSTFAPEKMVHLVLATQITPVCDCFGFTSMPVLPDAGIFGSDDIVALDQAVLDVTAKTPLIEENVPTSMEIYSHEGHPLQWLHGTLKDPYKVVEYGAALGLGSREYELVDVLPVEKIAPASLGYISAKSN